MTSSGLERAGERLDAVLRGAGRTPAGTSTAPVGTRGLASPKLIITAEELPSDAFEEELERER
jgi:hypothetical protein